MAESGDLAGWNDSRCASVETAFCRMIAASVIGPGHRKQGTPRQDAFGFRASDERAVVVLCDGAGSAARAETGARITMERVRDMLDAVDLPHPCATADPDEREAREGAWRLAAVDAVRDARAVLARRSREDGEGGTLRPYHATLVAAAMGEEGTVFVHVGDGYAAAVTLPDDETEQDESWKHPAVVSLPQNGQYSNETVFVTMDNWEDLVRVTFAPRTDVIVLMTDGPDAFALDAAQTGLATPLWHGIHRHLARVPIETGARDLLGTLDSRDARRIGSDDKTLAWVFLPRR